MRTSQVERSIESTGSPDRRITSGTSCSRLDRRPPSSLPARRQGVYTHHTCGPPPLTTRIPHFHLCTCMCDRLSVREPPSTVYRAYLRVPLSMGTGPYVLWIRACRFPSLCSPRGPTSLPYFFIPSSHSFSLSPSPCTSIYLVAAPPDALVPYSPSSDDQSRVRCRSCSR